jgi:hypothetical protein
LVAFINNGNGKFNEYLLTKEIAVNLKGVIGVKLAKAGIYQTVCSKDYLDCYPKSNLPIKIDFNSIELFKYESTSSIFYWDKKDDKFERIWISD